MTVTFVSDFHVFLCSTLLTNAPVLLSAVDTRALERSRWLGGRVRQLREIPRQSEVNQSAIPLPICFLLDPYDPHRAHKIILLILMHKPCACRGTFVLYHSTRCARSSLFYIRIKAWLRQPSSTDYARPTHTSSIPQHVAGPAATIPAANTHTTTGICLPCRRGQRCSCASPFLRTLARCPAAGPPST